MKELGASADAREQFAELVKQSRRAPSEPLPIDHWLASSLLQKAIRRGDAEMAARAAVTLFTLRGAGIWRRFLVIAFEDVGAACPEVLTITTAACTDTQLRRTGGDAGVAVSLARMLANAVKDRSSDYLVAAAQSLPGLAETRLRLEQSAPKKRLGMMAGKEMPLLTQVAAACAGALEHGGWFSIKALPPLIAQFERMGLPKDLVEATRMAALRTREPITIAVPLIWVAMSSDRTARPIDCPVPHSPTVNGVPLYALDGHTRIGRQAITQFARDNVAAGACLDRFVAPAARSKAAQIAVFYADAAPVKRRLMWSQSEEIEALGIASDFHSVGTTPEAGQELMQIIRENLDHLNAIRGDLITASQSEGGGR